MKKQMRLSRFSFVLFTFVFVFGVARCSNLHSDSSLPSSINSEKEEGDEVYDDAKINHVLLIDTGDGPISNRTKRNSGGGTLGASPASNSVEGLLASCQLTNLLLYQLLQQRGTSPVQSNPLGGLGNGAVNLGGFLQPFPAGAITQNLIIPQTETLQTYVTTTSFKTTLTSTAVLTIPLLFGNKPVPTTITRTKTYDVWTTEVQTLTSTIRASFSQIVPAAAVNSPITQTLVPEIQPQRQYERAARETAEVEFARQAVSSAPKVVSVESTEAYKENKSGGRKRKKGRKQANKKTKVEQVYEVDPYQYAQYGSRGSYEKALATEDENPNQESEYARYYTRRSKRGESPEEEVYDREYLLEPSYDTTQDFPVYDRCPELKEKTVTVVKTKTVTVTLEPTSSVKRNPFTLSMSRRQRSRGTSRYDSSKGY